MSFLPILLLHGWGGSAATTFNDNGWLDLFDRAGRDVLALDLPGHGPAGGSPEPGEYADLAQAVDALLPSTQLDVVGYSLGGKIALELASRTPDRFRRLVIGGVGDNIFLPEQNGAAVADALVDGLAQDAPAPVRALVEYSKASGSDPQALAAVLRRPPNPVADKSRLGRIQGDLLLVNGSDDGLAQPDSKLRVAIGSHEYAMLPGVDHFALPKCEEFRAITARFLEAGLQRFQSQQRQ